MSSLSRLSSSVSSFIRSFQRPSAATAAAPQRAPEGDTFGPATVTGGPARANAAMAPAIVPPASPPRLQHPDAVAQAAAAPANIAARAPELDEPEEEGTMLDSPGPAMPRLPSSPAGSQDMQTDLDDGPRRRQGREGRAHRHAAPASPVDMEAVTPRLFAQHAHGAGFHSPVPPTPNNTPNDAPRSPQGAAQSMHTDLDD